MKILSLNCHGLPLTGKKSRFERIAKMIKRLNVDLAFLQEVVFTRDLEHFEKIGYKLFFEKKRALVRGGLVILTKIDGRGEFRKFNYQGKRMSRQLVDRMLGKGMWVLELERAGLTVINTHLVRNY